MFLIKLEDSKMFGGRKNHSHWYIARKIRNKDEYKLNQLTHLYVPDKKRFNQLKNHILKKVKVTGFDVPSGMNVRIITRDHFNNEITFKRLSEMRDKKMNIRRNVKIIYYK